MLTLEINLFKVLHSGKLHLLANLFLFLFASPFLRMSHPCRDDQVSSKTWSVNVLIKPSVPKRLLAAQDATVVGFEVPRSPDSSYNNVYPGNEDEGREPPFVPPHLQQTMLNCPPTRDPSVSLPLPQNVTLNHLYLQNRETPRSVVALGVTHRFRSKFVTVVLYKPVQRRGSGST